MTIEKKKRPLIYDFSCEYLSEVILNSNQYEELVIGETIYELLNYFNQGRFKILQWMKDNLSENKIDNVIDEIFKFIKYKDNESFINDVNLRLCFMLDICCQMNFEKTKCIYESEKKSNYDFSFVYEKIIENYQLFQELESYKTKYKSIS